MNRILACLFLLAAIASARAAPRHILVRDFRTVKDGQVVSFNIGTAAHGPATVAVLKKHLPGTKVSVWADAPLAPELKRLMDRRFPDVEILTGLEVPKTDAELFLVSSGSSIAGSVQRSIGPWRKEALICAEQRSEMPLVRRAVYDRLPDDVKAACVVLEDFWSPDLALGVYRKCRCVFGIEMHSQVMAVGNGVPAVVMRHSGFGTKSGMWKDVGLDDWLMDIDDPGAAARAAAIVGGILADESAAKAKVAAARAVIDRAVSEAIRRAFP